eukprot:scaffold7411_cov165-Alexandrium_tamarense.AAC.1
MNLSLRKLASDRRSTWLMWCGVGCVGRCSSCVSAPAAPFRGGELTRTSRGWAREELLQRRTIGKEVWLDLCAAVALVIAENVRVCRSMNVTINGAEEELMKRYDASLLEKWIATVETNDLQMGMYVCTVDEYMGYRSQLNIPQTEMC